MATETYDLVVYGNTWMAVNAACAAANEGVRVALVSPYKHIGGVIANGLGAIDLGRYGSKGIGWLTAEFFRRLTAMSGSRVRLIRNCSSNVEQAFNDMLKFYNVYVRADTILASVAKTGTTITSMTDTLGNVYVAAQFIDGTEEGDLAKMAGVTMVSGRESQSQYGEPLAGFCPVPETFRAFNCYDSSGNLLYGFKPYPTGIAKGDADAGVQAYGFRLCITQDVPKKRPWPKPAGYDPALFEYLRRQAPLSNTAWKPFDAAACVDGKGDMNADYGIPFQWEWPEATPARRVELKRMFFNEQAGWHWFLANDKSVNPTTQAYVNSWGPAVDEFPDGGDTTGGWPNELYVRQARRMVGQYVMKQQDTQSTVTKADSIAVGFYSLDYHAAARLATTINGVAGFMIDGFGADPVTKDMRQVVPYQIPLRALLPVEAECSNLSVVKAVSASSVAMSSMRIDLHAANAASAAGLLAARALASGTTLNAYSVADLQTRLMAKGHVISYTA